MEKKIFISHSSLDTEIGEKFVDLLIEIGIPKEIIFFSSRYHTGVEIGHDFHKEIKEHLHKNYVSLHPLENVPYSLKLFYQS